MILQPPDDLLCFMLNNYVLKEDKGSLFNIIKKLLKDEYFPKKTLYDKILGISLEEYFNNIKDIKAPKIYQNIKLNYLTILPISTHRHSMIFVITKVKGNDNLYKVRFINSGLGTKYHKHKINANIKVQAMIGNYCTYEQICQIIFNANKNLEAEPIDSFYLIVVAVLFRTELDPGKQIKMENKLEENIWIEPQHVGNCTWRSLYLSLKIYCCHINKISESTFDNFFTQIALGKFNILLDRYLEVDLSNLTQDDSINLVITNFYLDCIETKIQNSINFKNKQSLNGLKLKYKVFLDKLFNNKYKLKQPKKKLLKKKELLSQEKQIYILSKDRHSIKELLSTRENNNIPDYPKFENWDDLYEAKQNGLDIFLIYGRNKIFSSFNYEESLSKHKVFNLIKFLKDKFIILSKKVINKEFESNDVLLMSYFLKKLNLAVANILRENYEIEKHSSNDSTFLQCLVSNKNVFNPNEEIIIRENLLNITKNNYLSYFYHDYSLFTKMLPCINMTLFMENKEWKDNYMDPSKIKYFFVSKTKITSSRIANLIFWNLNFDLGVKGSSKLSDILSKLPIAKLYVLQTNNILFDYQGNFYKLNYIANLEKVGKIIRFIPWSELSKDEKDFINNFIIKKVFLQKINDLTRQIMRDLTEEQLQKLKNIILKITNNDYEFTASLWEKYIISNLKKNTQIISYVAFETKKNFNANKNTFKCSLPKYYLTYKNNRHNLAVAIDELIFSITSQSNLFNKIDDILPNFYLFETAYESSLNQIIGKDFDINNYKNQELIFKSPEVILQLIQTFIAKAEKLKQTDNYKNKLFILSVYLVYYSAYQKPESSRLSLELQKMGAIFPEYEQNLIVF